MICAAEFDGVPRLVVGSAVDLEEGDWPLKAASDQRCTASLLCWLPGVHTLECSIVLGLRVLKSGGVVNICATVNLAMAACCGVDGCAFFHETASLLL